MGKHKNRKSCNGRYAQAIYVENNRTRDFMDFQMVSIRNLSWMAPECAKRNHQTAQLLKDIKKKYNIFKGKVLWAIISDGSHFDLKKIIVTNIKPYSDGGNAGWVFFDTPLTKDQIEWPNRRKISLPFFKMKAYFNSRRRPKEDEPILFLTERAAQKKMNEFKKEQEWAVTYLQTLVESQQKNGVPPFTK